MKKPRLNTKTMTAAAAIPGSVNGTKMERNVRTRPAPRLWLARISAGSIACIAAISGSTA